MPEGDQLEITGSAVGEQPPADQASGNHVQSGNHVAESLSPGRAMLRSWLNKNMKMKLSDGRVLIGVFLCTDHDANVILGSCAEYLSEPPADGVGEEPRILGLAMVPGKHIVSIHVDDGKVSDSEVL